MRYTNVIILEGNDRVGGKVKDTQLENGMWNARGALFTSLAYTRFHDLIQEYGINVTGFSFIYSVAPGSPHPRSSVVFFLLNFKTQSQ